MPRNLLTKWGKHWKSQRIMSVRKSVTLFNLQIEMKYVYLRSKYSFSVYSETSPLVTRVKHFEKYFQSARELYTNVSASGA